MFNNCIIDTKIMKQTFLITFLFISLVSFGQMKTDTTDETEMKPLQLLDIIGNVSMIKLIATPEKYQGKRIQIIGYLHLEFEGNAIYFHEEDCKKRIPENSFWVNFSNKLTEKKNLNDYNNKYVIIIGTFKMNDKGHLGLFGGTIDDIVRLDLWGNNTGKHKLVQLSPATQHLQCRVIFTS